MDELEHYVERTFRHVAEAKSPDFAIRMNPGLPVSMFTDSKRLQQIIKNLLSNAFKFTPMGQVTLTIEPVSGGWSHENESLNRAGEVLAISVSDTGIGISADKQQIIFEAFQQADGSTSRKYGGTGLGLAISRELARLLQGEIRLVSNPTRWQHVHPLRAADLHGARAPPGGLRRTPRRSPATRSRPRASRASSRRARASRTPAAFGRGPAPTVLASDTAPAVLVNEAGDDRDSIQAGDRVRC
jgi:signal transduction histidine kinase